MAARLISTRLDGSARPIAVSAARTRSRASPTALSGSPTTIIEGTPAEICTCTSTGTASMPAKAKVRMRAISPWLTRAGAAKSDTGAPEPEVQDYARNSPLGSGKSRPDQPPTRWPTASPSSSSAGPPVDQPAACATTSANGAASTRWASVPPRSIRAAGMDDG